MKAPVLIAALALSAISAGAYVAATSSNASAPIPAADGSSVKMDSCCGPMPESCAIPTASTTATTSASPAPETAAAPTTQK